MNNLYIDESAEKGAAFLDNKNPGSNISDVTGVTGVTPCKDAASRRNAKIINGVSNVTNQIPDKSKCPTFVCFDHKVKEGESSLSAGVWYFDLDKDGEVTKASICSALHIDAVTYDGQENNYGRLLRFKTTKGSWRTWAMPMELLKGSGDELRGELLAMGLQISPGTKARNLLSTFLQSSPPKKHIRCALQVGWCGDSFVLPDKVYGHESDSISFQSGERGHEEYTQSGGLEGWRSVISVAAISNPVLIIALSAAFAAPLARKCNAESGGFHFVGDSSIGKSSALEAACSVWGGENFKRSWRTTANGLEGAAVLFNDCLLALDEISECDPREIGAIVYALGNGRGKQRATRTGSARGVSRWRSFVLSTGERSIATSMNEGGYKSKAGQGVRLLDIPCKRSFGIYDDLHGHVSGQALSDSLKKATTRHYGIAGRSFLEKLAHDGQDFAARLDKIKSMPQFNSKEPQHKRAAARFAQVALAGELATGYGITGWPAGEAITAAGEGFRLWKNMRGKGNNERQQVLEQLSDFIDRHEESRFSLVNNQGSIIIRDKAGWRETVGDKQYYLFNSSGMKEALKGFDLTSSLNILVDSGVLPPPKSGKGERAIARRLEGKSHRVYEVNQSQLITAISNESGCNALPADCVTSVTPGNGTNVTSRPASDKACNACNACNACK